MDKPVIIFGAGQYGRMAYDIFMQNGVEVYCFLDDDESLHNKEIGEAMVMGKTDDEEILKYVGKNCAAFVGDFSLDEKKDLVNILRRDRKSMPVNAIHKLSFVSPQAIISHGNLVSAGVVINAMAVLKNYCVLGSNAVVEPYAQIGNYSQIGSGCIIGARAEVAAECLIGAGSIVGPGIKVGKGANIAPGAVVIKNVEEGDTVYGNPAKSIK